MSEGWYSKQDAIKDISIATGKCAPDFSEEFVIIGKQPPPRRWTPDDDDMEQSQRSFDDGSLYESNLPDLQGIIEMLRMYDEFNESSNVKESGSDNHILSISKLNPLVTEFVPRTSSCNNNINDVNKPEEIQNVKESSNVNKITCKTDNCYNNKNLVNGNRIDVSRLKPQEIEHMKEELKTKITDMSNTTCVIAKIERNLAMASLLKLHCRSPINIGVTNLNTPDYYKRSLSEQAERYVKVENVPNAMNGGGEHSEVNNSQVKENEVTKDVSDSIQKVKEWLHPKKSKEVTLKTVYLGPITFKRKVGKPPSPQSTESDAPSKISSGEMFVPSAFASKLTKDYEERLKSKETPPDIWTKLQVDLKVRDEIIKIKSLQHKNTALDGDIGLPEPKENVDN